jgi:hypothetical protein
MELTYYRSASRLAADDVTWATEADVMSLAIQIGVVPAP